MNMTEKVVRDIICPLCGCCCDDIEAVVQDNKIIAVRNSCELSAHKFMRTYENRLTKPYVRENGTVKYISIDEAAEKIAMMLINAKKPLLYGWSSTTCEATEVGIELAEEVGGVIDNTSTVCHGPSVLAIQNVGWSSCTLGEVKNRADLIIYWGSNPFHAHPRHMSRYSLFPRGFFRERGLEDRILIVVDTRKTDTAKLADYFIQVQPNKDYELISAFRMAVRGIEIPYKEVAGVPREEIYKITELMKKCHFGALFFGQGLTMSEGKHRNIDNAISLVTDLHIHTKFIIMLMRGHFNVTGANETLTWLTGYPFAVDFSQGYPRYNPGDTSANDILMNGECDAAFVIASDPVAHFPKKAVQHLAKIPLAVVDPFESLTSSIAKIVIPSTISGIEAEGTVYRMDFLPLRLRKVIEPPEGALSDHEIVTKILGKVRELKA